MIRADPRPALARRHGRRLRPRRLSAHDAAGGGARRAPARARHARSTSSSTSRCRTARCCCSGCSAARPRRTAPTTRRRRSSDGSSSTSGRPRRSSTTTARTEANVVGIHADRTVDEVFHEIEQSLDVGGGTGMIVRKSEAEIEGMARAGALLAETLALVGRAPRAGRRDARARPHRRRAHRGEGRPPDLEGLQGLSRPRSASRRTRWSCTGSPTRTARGKAT